MNMKEDNIVKIDFDSIYWEINVKETGKIEYENVDYRDPDPVIELSWGWTAGMTEDEMKEIADDSPTGYKGVRILLSQVIRLRDKLNELIEEE